MLYQTNPVLLITFIILMMMSVCSWYIVFWKAINLRKERNYLKNFRNQYIKTPDWPIHANFVNVKGNLELLVTESQNLKSVIKNYQHEEKREVLSMHLIQSLDMIKVNLDKGLTVLASIGSSAPFVGLFGTVIGIYSALTEIANKGNAGLDVVAGPMGEALVATAIGLFAAIPAVLAYNAYVRFNRLLVQDLRHIAEQLTIYLSLSPKEK